MTEDVYQIERGGLEILSSVGPLWAALYDRHLEYGAAGLTVIDRAESWPRRYSHYQHIFANRSRAVAFLARHNEQPIGYAVGYDEELTGNQAIVMETLSISPEARGQGLGTRLMTMLDSDAKRYSATTGIVDVVSGNGPAFGFYRAVGFAPHSETWIRSNPRPLLCQIYGIALHLMSYESLWLRDIFGADSSLESMNRSGKLSAKGIPGRT